MPKLHLFFMLLPLSIVSTAYTQKVVWVGATSTNNSSTTNQIAVCSFINNGEMKIPQNLAPATKFNSIFNTLNNICVNNNFSYEVRLRDSVGLTNGGERFATTNLLSSIGILNISVAENVASSQIALTLNGVMLGFNKTDLVFDLTKWLTLKIIFKNGVFSVLANGKNVANTIYSGAANSICLSQFTFLGSGEVDYVKIYDNTTGTFFYNENFDDCNNLAGAQACAPKTTKIIGNSPCVGDSLVLSTNISATTYVWAGPNGYSSKQPRVVIPKTDNTWSGTFYLTAQFDGCTTSTDSFKINLKPSPIIDIGRDSSICSGITYLLDAKNNGATYKWQNGTTGQFQQVKTSGVYAVTVTAANACKSSAAVKIDFAAASISPRVSISRASCANVCDGRLRVSATGGFGAPYIFKWTGGRVKDSIVDACPGDYGLTVTDSKGCNIKVVATLPSPVPIFIQTTFDTLYNGYANRCNDSKNAAIKVRATGGGGDFTFRWFNDPPQTTDYITNVGTGKIKVLATDKNNCSDTLIVNVDAPRPIEAFYKMIPPRCLGDKNGQIILDSFSGGTFPFKFQISNAVFDAKLNGWQNLAKGTYAVNITDANNCKAQKNFIVENPPKINLRSTPDTLIHYGDNVKLYATLDTPSVLKNISWFSNRDSALVYSCKNCATPEINPRIPTLFKVTITDTFGCVVTHDIIVQVDKRRPVFVPNIFSPNDDGNNDVLMMYVGNGVKKVLDFQIFNRWGHQVFSEQNVTPDNFTTPWDGTVNGSKCPPDTYTWFSRILFDDGETEIINGTVNLVR